ncbi:MAG: phosphomannomutase/phosphoglucomutase [Gammaproteobacteria bacterium]
MKRKNQPQHKTPRKPRKTKVSKPTSQSSAFPLDALASIVVFPLLLSVSLVLLVHTFLSNESNSSLNDFFKTELTRQITLAQQQLEAIAPSLSTPQMIQAIEAHDLATLKSLESALSDVHRDVTSVLLVPNSNTIDPMDTNAGISFAALNMLRQLEKNESVPLELAQNAEGAIIRHGANLYNAQGQSVGRILITLDQSAFTQFFSQIPPTFGQFTVQQRALNTEIPWHSSSQQPMPPNAHAHWIDTDGDGINDWHLLYTIDAPFPSLLQELLWGLAGGLLTSFLLAAIIFQTRRRLLTAIEKNLQNLVHQVKSGLSNPSDIGYTVDGFEAAHRSLKGAIDAIAQKRKANQQTAGKSATLPAGMASNQHTPKQAIEDQSLLDLDLDLADDDLFESADSLEDQLMSETTKPIASQVPAEIFRQYDIRGIVGESLSPEIMELLGKAIGTTCLEKGDDTLVIGRDGRLSSPALFHGLSEGVRSTGCAVIDIGVVPTPFVYFATKHANTESGVMITGSHNPSNYNGLKIVISGQTLYGDSIQHLHQLIQEQRFREGSGALSRRDITHEYIDRIAEDVAIARSLKVVVDAGNGVAGPESVHLLQQLGCEVIELYCDIDGHFPNHHPDPSKPENLSDLIEAVSTHQADIGLAFDGDGDRLGVVTPKGKIIFPDRLLMLFARDILSRNPGGDIIFDIKCTGDLNALITSLGGRPIMWKTGHSLIKAKLKETGALMAGEMSGHIFFNDRWYGFDDALYSAARLLEILSSEAQDIDAIMDTLPEKISTPEINIPVTEETKFEIIEALTRSGEFQGHVVTLDGIRVDYKNGWGLVRASNTTPNLVARFEADTNENLLQIQNEFKTNLLNVNSELGLPF